MGFLVLPSKPLYGAVLEMESDRLANDTREDVLQIVQEL